VGASCLVNKRQFGNTKKSLTTIEELVAKARCVAHLSAIMGGHEESAQFAASLADDLLAMNMASGLLDERAK
jgi:hypothetical protein